VFYAASVGSHPIHHRQHIYFSGTTVDRTLKNVNEKDSRAFSLEWRNRPGIQGYDRIWRAGCWRKVVFLVGISKLLLGFFLLTSQNLSSFLSFFHSFSPSFFLSLLLSFFLSFFHSFSLSRSPPPLGFLSSGWRERIWLALRPTHDLFRVQFMYRRFYPISSSLRGAIRHPEEWVLYYAIRVVKEQWPTSPRLL
jgi:hypothetical protein